MSRTLTVSVSAGCFPYTTVAIMPPPEEHVELQGRSDFVDVPLDDQPHQPQSSSELHIPRRVGMAATVVLVTTVASVVLIVTTASVPKQQEVLIQNYPQSGIVSPSALTSAFHEVMVPVQSSALPSPLLVSKHPKNVIRDKIREMKEKHRQRNVPDPNYEEVAVQLKKEREHDTGVLLPSSKSEQHFPHPLPSMDPGYVEEEVTLQKYEEHDKHPRNVKIPVATQDIQPQIPFSDKEATKIKETEDSSSKNRKSPMKQIKESNRLPSKSLKNGTQIQVCETTACYEAATRISESLDHSVNPCDDFYQFACGGWIDKHPVPESGWGGTYIDAVKRMDKHLLQILETPAKPDAPAPLHEIRSLYSSCLDTDTMNELGLDPLVNLLSAAQGGWPMVMETWDPNSFSLSTALNNLRSLNVYPLIQVYISTDVFNTSRWLIFVDAGQVPAGASVMGSVSNDTLAPYHTFMTSAAKMLRDFMESSASDQDIDSQVNDVIEFEMKFSKIVMKAINETTDHAWQTTVAELQEDTDAGTPHQIEWLSFLEEMFAETDITITKDEPLLSFKGPFFRDFSNLLATTDPKTLANAIGWWWVYVLQQETTYAMRNASHTYMQDFYGQSRSTPRWQYCISITNRNMGFALSREYVDHFVPHTVKPEVTELTEDLRGAFSSLLNNNTWMLPEDLQVAQEKLAAIDPFVAYPDWIMDDKQLAQGYEGLNLVNGEHIDNLVHIGAWYNLNALAALRDVPEHSFLYPPTIVNSVYNPIQNSITILSGMLQSPFYGHNSLAAVNYGSLGMIIGHEMTHGFDSTGRMFDKFGNLRQWWSNETIEAFNEHAMCFVKQYDKYVPPELSEIGLNITVSGVQTLGENIADNGGIREAFHAYKMYVNRYGEEPRLPGLEEFSPDHIFYLSFANPWCEHKSPEMALQLLFLDAHSPGKFRVLGSLSNDDEFSKVWNCPAGSPMNSGKDRCLLW
ncbi:neprilysin-1-like isoform X1 [Scylla paramamosain]|uniref:neprilysin-1-like isoform X1 n=2 Tax=Scylla paramamosain TaxID=85552 RepID=UPI0030836BEF